MRRPRRQNDRVGANGNKAAPDSSYHGGSRRGGYSHGLAADLVSMKGETPAERCTWSEVLWKWIDAHEKDLGIGRPYLDKDPPLVAPNDGKEYADKRSAAKGQLAGLKKTVAVLKPKVNPSYGWMAAMSALPLKADKVHPGRDVRSVQKQIFTTKDPFLV